MIWDQEKYLAGLLFAFSVSSWCLFSSGIEVGMENGKPVIVERPSYPEPVWPTDEKGRRVNWCGQQAGPVKEIKSVKINKQKGV